ncbi:MAG: GGDEF domain-containing protein, partial [Clostridium sp.]
YGHVVGNIVLKEVSNILINSVRRGDIVARYGGEEFGIVIPEVDKEGAFQLCERIRRNMEEYDFDIGSEIIKLTVSIGVFFKDKEEIITGSEIIEKADEELYNAKRNGRNRVEINIL